MSDCPSRYLTADGRTLACFEPAGHPCDCGKPDWHHDTGCPRIQEHNTPGGHAWPDGDPCAWDATCPACEGQQFTDGRCLTCMGAGTVDTIPPALIGPGSKLEQPDGSWAYVLDNYGPGNAVIWDDATRSGERVNVSARIIDRDAIGTIYEVVRAVPPAGDAS